MNLLIKLTTIAAVAFGCIACGAGKIKDQSGYVYDNEASKAMNVMRAAKIDKGLKDQKVPKDQYRIPSKMSSFGSAVAIQSYFSAPIPGWSGSQSLGVGLALQMFKPSPKSERNAVIAWMPVELAGENPVDNLSDIFITAMKAAAQELGFDSTMNISEKGKSGIAIALEKPGVCEMEGKLNSICWMSVGFPKPQSGVIPPPFVSTGPTYYFDPAMPVRTLFKFNPYNKSINQLEFLAHVSEHLPSWVYLYAAPNTVITINEKKSKVPLILNEGTIYPFLVPKS